MTCAPRPIAAILAFAVLLAGGAATAEAREIENWPCKRPYAEEIPASAVWQNAPALDETWRDDAPVSALVDFAINPENRPARGQEAIAAYAAGIAGDRRPAMIRVFSGLLAETNSLYRITVVGIRSFILRAKILNEEVQQTDAQLAALPSDDAARGDLKQARFWNFRNLDDAEEEAEFLCRRLNYMEFKLRSLTETLRDALQN